jgi:FXSXX-COOH protein
METSATDVEIDFDVVNLSGSANVDLDELPMNALGGSIRRVRRDTLVHRAADVSMFTSAL